MAVGGNVAGNVLKQYDLGTLGNSIAGVVGGGIGGHSCSASWCRLSVPRRSEVGPISARS